MKKSLFGLGLLCLMLGATAASSLLWPSTASAAACPSAPCANVAAACNGLGCGIGLTLIGTCTDSSGGTHNLYAAQCPACHIFTTCYI